MRVRGTRSRCMLLLLLGCSLLCHTRVWGQDVRDDALPEQINKAQEIRDLAVRKLHWDIPAGNIWLTMLRFQLQAKKITGIACNFCSGPQPCSIADMQKGSCVPQCPGPTDEPRIVSDNGCSLPCAALDSITTPPVQGELGVIEALERLLEGTGLTYALVNRMDEGGFFINLLDARRHFDIPEGPLLETAPAFRRQAGVHLYIPKTLVVRARTSAVHGYMTPMDALNHMLQGSGWEYFTPEQFSVNALFLDNAPQQVLILGQRSTNSMELLSQAQVQRVEAGEITRARFSSIESAIEDLPTNLMGRFKEDIDRGDNPARGTAADLRGLGPAATLVLFNGRRQPGSGFDARFVDLSTMPWAAVETIEVLPDGASATYGAGAIGGVVNIRMRSDRQAVETRLRSATPRGGATERLVSQLLADSWNGGRALIAYQFAKREALPIAARAYARDTDKRPLGGSDFSSTASNPGTILDPITLAPAYAIPGVTPGTALTVANLVPGANLYNWQAGSDLLPARTAHSAYLSAAQQLGSRWKISGDVRFHEREISLEEFSLTRELSVPRSNPYFLSPFNGPTVQINYNFGSDLGNQSRRANTRVWDGGLTLEGPLGRDWRVTLNASYGQEDLDSRDRNLINDAALQSALADESPITAFNPYGTSVQNPDTLESIRDSLSQRALFSLTETSVSVHGSLGRLAGGPIRFSAGAGARAERLTRQIARNSFAARTDSQRESHTVFADLGVPLSRTLDVAIAERFEGFTGSGDALAHKLALLWKPFEGLHFRVTRGESYNPPGLQDTRGPSFIGFLNVQDPRSASGRSRALVRVGSSSELEVEKAKTWTIGLDLISIERSAKLSLTYFDIGYHHRIITPGSLPTSATLLEESTWGNIISRDPPRELIEQLCHSALLIGSSADCLASTPIVIDGRVRNGGTTYENGMDAVLEKISKLRRGELVARASAMHLFHFTQANGSLLPPAGLLAQVGNPPRTRFATSLDWYQRGEDRPGFSAGIALSHVSAFADTSPLNEGRSIRSLTELDARLGYRSNGDGGWLDGLEVRLDIANLTDAAPPFANRPLGYDQANAQPYGRVVSMMVQKNF